MFFIIEFFISTGLLRVPAPFTKIPYSKVLGWRTEPKPFISKLIPKEFKCSLIITGTPYNNNSDAPERKKLGGKNSTFNYNKQLPNLAWLKDKEYYETLKEIYNKCINYLKLDGYFCIIIKDTIRNKSPYLLHKHLTEILLETGKLELEAVYLHKHHPPTLFMSTYNKIWKTNIKVPKYQTIVVLKKNDRI